MPGNITTNLVGYWKFDDGTGGTATDSSVLLQFEPAESKDRAKDAD
jgi:hypothetical protein